ncbi:hypothetical protein [Monoglobus pectinilyticus]|uniref:hypothetical protein n=1 Tax=Monoglobus pectinilyticus TaxID=1981510 RepID=UPI0039995494
MTDPYGNANIEGYWIFKISIERRADRVNNLSADLTNPVQRWNNTKAVRALQM